MDRSLTKYQILNTHGRPGSNITDEDHGNLIMKNLYNQKLMGYYCDVKFIIESQHLYAHQCVMASVSSFFEYQFNTTDRQMINHVVENFTVDVFQNALDFVYTGIVVISQGNVSDLLRLANHYIIPKLKSHCSDYLERNLTVANCYLFKSIAESSLLPQLVKTIEAFIITNVSDVIQQNEIMGFSDHNFENFMSNRSMPLTEELKFSLLLNWIQHEFPSRHLRLPSFLQHIQWEKVNIVNILTSIRDCVMFKDHQWCLFVMLQVLEEKNLLAPAHLPTLQNLREIHQGINNQTVAISTAITMPHVTMSQGTEEANCMKENSLPSDHLGQDPPRVSSDRDSDDDSSIPVPMVSTPRDDQPPSPYGGEDMLDIAGLSSMVSIEPVTLPTDDDNMEPVAQLNTVDQLDTAENKPQKSSTATRRSERKLKNKDPSNSDVMPLKSNKSKRGTKHKCSKCSYTARDSKKIEAHVNKVHNGNEETKKCPICGYCSTWNRDYYKHMKIHFPGPPFHCDQEGCDWTGDRMQQLLPHRMSHTDERPYACHLCAMKFRTKNNLDSHIRGHKGKS